MYVIIVINSSMPSCHVKEPDSFLKRRVAKNKVFPKD